MKINILTILLFAGIAIIFYAFTRTGNIVNTVLGKTFHDLTIKTLDGKSKIKFSDFKGKKVLCVNVASECGYTYQYEGLQQLAEKYKDKVVVIGFPCNQFGAQEPGNAEEISSFCKKNYKVAFPLTEKIDVKGENQHPVYQWLCQKANNGVKDVEVRWNFGKFLIDEKGNFVEYYGSKTLPMGEEITKWAEK